MLCKGIYLYFSPFVFNRFICGKNIKPDVKGTHYKLFEIINSIASCKFLFLYCDCPFERGSLLLDRTKLIQNFRVIQESFAQLLIPVYRS